MEQCHELGQVQMNKAISLFLNLLDLYRFRVFFSSSMLWIARQSRS